jgi:thiamine-monophosphate kinase
LQSERELIERIARLTALREGVTLGIGDDAAVIAGEPLVVVTQDLLVDGVHFRRSTSSLADIGHKAVAVNLSDLAAMGAVAVAVFIGLGLPVDDPLGTDDIDALYAGMESLAALHGVTIAGGDITSASALILAVTAMGHMPAGIAPCRRSTARPGDLVCVTGTLGGAAAGLLLLDQPNLATGIAEADALRAASRRPTPRLLAGQRLAAGEATAMMDCSDGLALDASRLADASQVAIEIDLEAVPLAPGVTAVATAAGRTADLLAATGGDDYELIVTMPAALVDQLAARIDVPLTPVGRVLDGSGLTLRRNGLEVDVPTLGWEHRFD